MNNLVVTLLTQILDAFCEVAVITILPTYWLRDYDGQRTMYICLAYPITQLDLLPRFYLGVKPLDEDISLEPDCIFVATAHFIVYWSNGLVATCYYFIWLSNAIIKLI